MSNDLRRLVQSIGFNSVDAAAILNQSKKSKSISSEGVLNISQTDEVATLSSSVQSPGMTAILKAVLVAGLYPNIAKISYQVRLLLVILSLSFTGNHS